ncbi:lysine biosynthesis protein LysW [Candidatus Shapirobacteria bacterium]|nr:lysine biosynthesis protein LysW [Candidatus Shapirobacteria bacterium]
MTVKCPDCQKEVLVSGDAEVGEIIECENCGAEMEIVSLDPPRVLLIEEEK